MDKVEELARQAEERAAEYQKDAVCKVRQEKGEIVNARTGGDVPGKGKGATAEQWPDGACGCGTWGSR